MVGNNQQSPRRSDKPRPKRPARRATTILIHQDRIRYTNKLWGTSKPNELIVATDATALRLFHSTTGIAYICNNGRYGFAVHPSPRRIVGPSKVTAAELRAIWYALEDLKRERANRPITILTDSQAALRLMQAWRTRQQPAPSLRGYQLERASGRTSTLVQLADLLASHPNQFKLLWVPGHPKVLQPHPLNTGAHELARLSFRLQQQKIGLPETIRQARTIARRALAGFARLSARR